MSNISKNLAELDAIINGALAIGKEALARKADLKQSKLALKAYDRALAEIKREKSDSAFRD